MAQLSGTNLFTLPAAGAQGWNSQYDDNLQEIRDRLGNIIETATNNDPGDATVADPAATTAVTLTDSTTGAASQTINDVTASFSQTILNDNFASLVDEINKLRADNVALRTQLVSLLSELRTTTGCGVLDG